MGSKKVPEVSVIMPTLNVVKYIEQCMKSVINQTLRDLEIIVIDAGSTDGTLEILQEYAAKDSRIRLISSDKKSYGYQVNMGISLAKGNYIGIVETDDYIESDMYEVLLENAKAGDYEYVKGTAEAFREISKDIVISSPIKSVEGDRVELKPSEHPELFSTDRFLWLGIYRADFVKMIRLNETPGAAYQDIGFMYQVLTKAQKALYLDKVGYHYRQDNMNASGYNHKAFKYLTDEYSVLLKLEMTQMWQAAVYKKMLEQCLGRFNNMAISGKYWDEYAAEIEMLREWLLDAENQNIITEEIVGDYSWNLLQIWKSGSDDLYRHYVEAYSQKNDKVRKCFQNIGGCSIVIFGAGKYGRFFHTLSENRYPGKVVAYCDNKPELTGTLLQGVEIVAPETAVERYPQAVFVISVYKDVETVYVQLSKLGVCKERIVRYEPECDNMLLNMKY